MIIYSILQEYLIANKVVDEIERVIVEVLAENPNIGTSPSINVDVENLLFFPAGKYPVYEIFYQLQGDTLEVYRVLHGKRNIEKILK